MSEELFNLINLKDLEYLCEIAAAKCAEVNNVKWWERAQRYRKILNARISEIEALDRS